MQCVLLAFRRACGRASAPAAVVAGFAFAYGSVIWDTAMQRTVAREKLARVSAYSGSRRWCSCLPVTPSPARLRR